MVNRSTFAMSIPRRQQHIMASIIYLVFNFLAFFTPVSSPTPTAKYSPTCHEPTSGPHGKALSAAACLDVANTIIVTFPDITMDLTHGPATFWDWVSCPLTIERDGCYLSIDYSRPPSLRDVVLDCSRHLIVSTILLITSQCVAKNNVDGGELVLKRKDGSSISFSLTHPPTTLSGVNRSSTVAAGVNSSFFLGPAEQGTVGTN